MLKGENFLKILEDINFSKLEYSDLLISRQETHKNTSLCGKALFWVK